MPGLSRWAGVPLAERRVERRNELVAAAFALFGGGGEAAVSVRSVCRACELNARYFYQSFAHVDELLGAVYDHAVLGLGAAIAAAMESADDGQYAQTRAGVRAVLGFSSANPDHGRILFTAAPANPVLIERRSATENVLFRAIIAEDGRLHPDGDPLSATVGAVLFTGAMTELVQQWLRGRLGSDLEAVLDYALKRVLPS